MLASIEAVAARDARVSAKPKPAPRAGVFYRAQLAEITRWAVVVSGGDVSRDEIADALGITRKSIDKLVMPSEERMFSADHFFTLVEPGSPLGEDVRRTMLARMGTLIGCTVAPKPSTDADTPAGVSGLVMGLTACCGRVADRVRSAMGAGSPGGGSITREELREIADDAEHARMVADEIAELDQLAATVAARPGRRHVGTRRPGYR